MLPTNLAAITVRMATMAGAIILPFALSDPRVEETLLESFYLILAIGLIAKLGFDRRHFRFIGRNGIPVIFLLAAATLSCAVATLVLGRLDYAPWAGAITISSLCSAAFRARGRFVISQLLDYPIFTTVLGLIALLELRLLGQFSASHFTIAAVSLLLIAVVATYQGGYINLHKSGRGMGRTLAGLISIPAAINQAAPQFVAALFIHGLGEYYGAFEAATIRVKERIAFATSSANMLILIFIQRHMSQSERARTFEFYRSISFLSSLGLAIVVGLIALLGVSEYFDELTVLFAAAFVIVSFFGPAGSVADGFRLDKKVMVFNVAGLLLLWLATILASGGTTVIFVYIGFLVIQAAYIAMVLKQGLRTPLAGRH